MLYQRKQQQNDILKTSNNQNKPGEKKVISTTITKIITTETKPLIEESKHINLTQKKDIQEDQKNISQISITQSEKESSLSTDRKATKFKVYLSSRYRVPKETEIGKISLTENFDNNLHNLNVRKSPDNISYKSIAKTEQKKELNFSQYSSNPVKKVDDNKTKIEKDSVSINKKENIEITMTSPNCKRYRQAMIPQNIMSPIKHYDDGNFSHANKIFSEKKTKATNNMISNQKIEKVQTKVNNKRTLFSQISKEKNKNNRNESYENKNVDFKTTNIVSYKELKKIVKNYNKIYDPNKNEKGLLIKQYQVTVPGALGDIFNNRNRVLSKMNKLSNILLSQQKNIKEDNATNIRNDSKEDNIKYRNKNKGADSKNKKVKKDKKLLLFSLAMMSSKNLNDKIILRKMRNEKGGVVDLAQDKINKNKFKIKKATKAVGGEIKGKRYSPKEKEKAAKIIQSWWKELKDIYDYKLSQIIKIQTIWKGRWLRKNIYDLLYLNYLYLGFCQAIEKVLTRKMTKFAFDKLISKYKTTKNKYSNKNETEKEHREEINMNGKKIIKITKITESERYISQGRKDKIIEKDKFKGLLKILEGANKYHKKKAFENTKPKISKYLKILSKKEILRKILGEKTKKIHYILKNAFFKWLAKAKIDNLSLKKQNEIEKEKIFSTNIKGKLFFRRTENIKNKQKKSLLRKYFYKYLKNALLLGKKEEHKKYLDLYNTDNYEPIYKAGKNEPKTTKYNRTSLSTSSYSKNKKTGLYDGSNNLKACLILEKYMRRKTHKYILQCFKRKIKKMVIIEQLAKIVKTIEKIRIIILKRYLDKWKKRVFQKQKNDLISKMFIKIIKIIIENKEKKLLSKKFYQWQRITNILKGKDTIFTKSKITYNFIEKIKHLINKRIGTLLMNKLKNKKKRIYFLNILKKIIIKRNNIRNSILLKNGMARWKNKVIDYEIGRLKGKLLLKIYDKYKTNKKRDILKKYLYKWGNNTIFIDKIKNRINKENIDIFTKKNNTNKITIILRSIIRNINRKNNDIKLRKYFYKWIKNIQGRIKNLKSFEVLKNNKKEISLKNILIKYGKLRTKEKIKSYYFSKWLYLAKILKQTEYANVIQNFCHIHLRNKKIINRWKKLSDLLKIKYRKNNRKAILITIKKYSSIIKLLISIKRKQKLKSLFLNKLKFLKKKTSPNHILKKIIIRYNDKRKNIILKKALNIWKNKVANIEIERLKGKLLLKMYDKYKVNKRNDIIKKVLYKWKNNTIFIDEIKKKINKENINIYNIKNNKNKITILLKSIVRNINRKKRDILRNYFNKWNKKLIDKKNQLINAEANKLKVNEIKNKKTKLLKSIIIKHKKPKNEILKYYFRKWLYINKKIKQNEYANIIQNFCLIKLRNARTKNNWKKFSKLLRNKNRKNNIKNIIEIIKKYISIKNIVKAIKRNRNKFYKKFIAYILKGINTKKDRINQNHILRKLIIRQNNRIKNKLLKNALNFWKNKTADYEIGKLKGKLLLKIYDKYKQNKIRELIKKILYKWENNTIFIDKIKNKLNKENIDEYAKKYNNEKVIIIFKSLIRNINRKNNDRILRKYFNKWQQKAKKSENKDKNLIEGGEHLLKVIKKNSAKNIIYQLKDNQKDVTLKKIVIKSKKPNNDDILNYYFNKWLFANKKMNQINNANIIQKFCLIKLMDHRAIKNWKKLYTLLKDLIKRDYIKEIVNLLKYYISIKNITRVIKQNNKKNLINVLKTHKNNEKIEITLYEKIDIVEKKNNNNLLNKYFNKWKNSMIKDNDKQKALGNMLNVLDKKTLTNSVKNITDIFLVSKLLKDIPKIRALNFLKNIKKEGRYHKLYKIIAYDIVDVKEDLLNKSKKPFLDKILKIYVYKVLSNLFKKLENRKKNVINKYKYMKDFFYKIYDINMEKNTFGYMKEESLEREPNIKKGIKFKILKKPKVKRDEKNNKIIVYKQLAPFLVKYINRIFRKPKIEIFDKIRYNTNGDKFTKLLKNFVKKTQIPDKEDLVDSLKYYVYIKITKETSSNKLYNLIRKAIIRKILNVSRETGSLIRFLHLVKITITHKKIAKDRWLKNLIRRWRFITFIKKMAIKKMELMYKDLHVTYLDIANIVLNEDSPMIPYEKRFLPDIEIEKYLKDFNDPYLIKGAKPYQGTKRQYIFKPIDAEMEKQIKYIKEVETVDRTREINKTYYNYDNDNDNNKGFKNTKLIDGKNSNSLVEERKYYKNIETDPNLEQIDKSIDSLKGDIKGNNKKEIIYSEKRKIIKTENDDEEKRTSKNEGLSSSFGEGKKSIKIEQKNYRKNFGGGRFGIKERKEIDNEGNEQVTNKYEYRYETSEKGIGKDEDEDVEEFETKGGKRKTFETEYKKYESGKDKNNKSGEKAYYFSSLSYYKGPGSKIRKSEENI